MGLLDFLRRRRPADREPGTAAGVGSMSTTDTATMAAAAGTAAIATEGNVPPAEEHGGSDPGPADGGESGAAGHDSGGGFEGGGDSGGGGGDSGGGGGDSGGGGGGD
jgi:hypothetical protein